MYISKVVLIGSYKAGTWTGWRSFTPLCCSSLFWVTETGRGPEPPQTQRTNGSELPKWELSLKLLSQWWSTGLMAPAQCAFSVKLCVSFLSLRGWAAEKSELLKEQLDNVVSPWGVLLAEPEAWFLEAIKQRSKCSLSCVPTCSQEKEKVRIGIYLWEKKHG